MHVFLPRWNRVGLTFFLKAAIEMEMERAARGFIWHTRLSVPSSGDSLFEQVRDRNAKWVRLILPALINEGVFLPSSSSSSHTLQTRPRSGMKKMMMMTTEKRKDPFSSTLLSRLNDWLTHSLLVDSSFGRALWARKPEARSSFFLSFPSDRLSSSSSGVEAAFSRLRYRTSVVQTDYFLPAIIRE